jgi:hypothetical protein
MTVPDAFETAQEDTPTQTERLIESGRATLQLFHDRQERPYAEPIVGRRGVLPIPSKRAARVLQLAFKQQYGRYPNPAAVGTALEALATEAALEGPEVEVYTRVGKAADGGLVLDLAADAGQLVVVSEGAWTVASQAAVHFHRREGSHPVPAPRQGGTIELLRAFVNVGSDEDFVLLTSWAAMALSPTGPYPVLIVQGEPGSAKSTTCEVLKRLIDPTRAPLRSMPQNIRDLAIAAEANWVLSFDNLSGIPTLMSDALCRLATGGGFGTRALYRDDEERVFEQQRPIILNGIDAVATRQDLLDRAIVLTLPAIEPGSRRDEATFWTGFEAVRPLILGALLDGVARADSDRSSVEVPDTPRMADFARWAAAAAPAFNWTPERFVKAYSANRALSLRTSLDGSPVFKALRTALELNGGCIEGTPTGLWEQIHARVPEHDRRRKGGFPTNPQSLSRHLRLLSGALREEGIEIEIGHLGSGADKTRWVTVRYAGAESQNHEDGE